MNNVASFYWSFRKRGVVFLLPSLLQAVQAECCLNQPLLLPACAVLLCVSSVEENVERLGSAGLIIRQSGEHFPPNADGAVTSTQLVNPSH